MGWLIRLILFDDFTGIQLFKLFSLGITHHSNNVKGILFGIWRLQLQISIGYKNNNIKIEGEGYA